MYQSDEENESRALAVVPASYSRAELDLIRNTVAKDTTDMEFQLFIAVCQQTGLSPFARQIYAIVRGKDDKRKMTIQTGIDGYRLLAARTGALAGIEEPVYDTETEKHPNKATVTVYRLIAGQRIPFTASARWAEYKPDYGDQMWVKMPYLMLGKCAEALALRKAFPAEICGVYTAEEMSQADAEPGSYIESAPAQTVRPAAPKPTSPAPKPATAKLSWSGLRKRAQALGITTQDTWESLCIEATGNSDPKSYGEREYLAVEAGLADLEKARDEAALNAPGDDTEPELPASYDLRDLGEARM